ncbi:BTAD domain-containing putative transcriptional regulator [Microbacterium tumbae]
MLGPVAIIAADGRRTTLPGATSRALLASLALAAPGRRGAEALADDLWGDDPPRNPRGSVQTLVSRLRSAAGATLTTPADLIRSEVDGYALAVDTDLSVAQDLDAEAARLDEADPARLALFDDALALWHGEPGADLGRAPVATALSETASALRDRMETSRARSLIALGRPGEAVVALASRVASHPYDEPMHIQLMTALAADDRPQEALAVFAALRERLREHLGSDPGPAATALNAGILRGGSSAPSAQARIGLRAEPNPLIGRETELREIASELATARLVTLLGVGGIGKTRLAQSVAAASFSPLVAVVPLAGIRDDDDLAPAIADALGISEARAGGRLADARLQPDLRSRVVAMLSERPALLVLDNCEHIVGGVAEWIADMLASVPTLRVLTTSRTPIAIAGEIVHPVSALSTGTAADADEKPGPAVRLFLDRARAVRPDAVLDRASVIRLCERLDGLPLAIELAAARVRSMTAAQIEARLENRFALLTSADRSAPERHRTLQAVIEWSWDLLDPDAQHALAALSLLPAGFSATTAAGVLGATQADDILDRLVAQSLLVVVDDRLTSGIRFRMLETVREFGLARLAAGGGESAAWDAVLSWAGAYTRKAGASLFGPYAPLRAEVFREIRAEHDNLLAALRHALDTRRIAEAVLVAATLTQSWIVRGAFTELFGFVPAILDAVRDMPDEAVPGDALATVLLPCAVFALLADDPRGLRALARTRRLLRRDAERMSPPWRALTAVIDESSDPGRMVAVLAGLRESEDPSVRLVGEILTAQFAENDGDAVTAAVSSRRAWELSERSEQSWLSAMAASSAAQLASQSADPAQAMIWFERARRGFEDFGAEEELRQLDWTLGGSLIALGRLDEADALFERLASLGELTQEGLEFGAIGWFGLAEVQRARGNPRTALAGYERALERFHSVDQRASPWYVIAMAGFVSAAAMDRTLPDDAMARWARRLRSRVLALRRMRPDFVDKPVLGAALAGWSSWALDLPPLRARAIEALALAEVLGARQDLPSLHIAAHRARAAGIVGDDVVSSARAAASALPVAARADRAYEVLRGRAG